ncbi:MAG: glycosyltransferase family 2 protein, partial [Lachnospiraceae bacterium]|nr:glycosyltransferase family 2 protein [Lachnospiraceae bacterium]
MISLIVPVYNAEKYLDACVRSILAQDEADWELLLVDDASADTSLSICERYAAEDERIHVIRASHGGAAAARNRGIEAAKGAWITFVDSDDTVEPYYLSYLLGLTEGGADIAACAHDKPREGEAAVALPGSAGATFYEGDDVLKTLLYQRGLMSVPWGYLSRRSLWEHVRFPEGTEAEDMGTIYRLFMEAGSLMVGRRVCYHYIQRKGNTIYSTAESRRKAYWRHRREMLK